MRVRPLLSALGLALVTASVVLACSAGVANPGLSDGGTMMPTGDGGCINPTEGAACTSGDRACSSGGDICCIGYAFACISAPSGGATWQKENVGCACTVTFDAGAHPDAGPIVCGGKACKTNEYCTTSSGGQAPADGGSNTSYVCGMIPNACVATPTCACLMANGISGCQCNDSSGWPYVTCNFP